MLKCDGYKMFKGTATVTPVNGKPPYDMTGTWLFRPDTNYWYVEDGKTWWAQGIDPAILSNFREDNT